MNNKSVSILITTKNRLTDLQFTLSKIQHLLNRNDVECLICDDGSTDGTSAFLQINYPKIRLSRNPVSKGLIYSRNNLLNQVNTDYAISIDDDLHFITEEPIELIESHFKNNINCALIGFRIFWSLEAPNSTISKENPIAMQSFAGGANVWRMSAWRDIPNYPDWFIFYGEEDFAAYQLFKKKWEIHYLPEVLVHHRVDLKSRKKNADYRLRLRRSLRSGWYLCFMFYPLRLIPRLFVYSLWVQIRNKTFRGDWMATISIVQALFDIVLNFPKIVRQSNRLSNLEYKKYLKLENTKIYWKPENE